MKKLLPFVAALCLILTVVWQMCFSDINYYLVSAVLLVLSMIPFLTDFERTAHSAGELTLIAGLIALAVVSRVVFYLVPQVKPIAAVVGVSGACLGSKRGYIIGLMSMLVSNFIFTQGPWTPFQMVAMGLVGMIFGLLFYGKKTDKYRLAIVGFVSVFVVYGLVVDLSSVLFFNPSPTFSGVLTVYLSGMLFNLIFAVTTAVCLLLFGEQLCRKIERINTKYIRSDYGKRSN